MKEIKDKEFDGERALYESREVDAVNCRFCGIADGESAFKESRQIKAQGCYFDLRYPFWHNAEVEIEKCEMTEKCRAPLWYTNDISIRSSVINGTKAIRECCGVNICDTTIVSDELGWDSCHIKLESVTAKGMYMFSRSRDIQADNLKMEGKYSFQYIENAVFENCILDTKDAFWHAKNVTVKNSVVNGEYLGWYSENLTFENCIITGTQPLCYCKGLTLINCEMHGCDLAFEKSHVTAEITTPVVSIKNVLSGTIIVPHVDLIIKDKDEYNGKIISLKS